MPEKAVRKSEKGDQSRQRVLDAAARLFCEEGYSPVSLRAIARAAGLKPGSLYYHFEAKEQIIAEVLDLGIQVVHDAVAGSQQALPEAASAGDRLRAGIRAHLDALLAFSDYTSANVRIYGQVPEDIRQGNLKIRRHYELLWDEILSEAAARGGVRADVDRKAFRLMLIGSLNATLEWFDPKRGSVGELADSYADILLNGLLEREEAGDGRA